MRPSSANSRYYSTNSYSKSQTHKKDKYSFCEEPRFLNLNINILQTVEGSSKKIINRSVHTQQPKPLWDSFLAKTPDYTSENSKNILFHKNKSNIFEGKPQKNFGKRAIALEEFDKNISKSSLKYNDPKIENLKKTIFSNFSNNSDFYSIEYKNNFITENTREYLQYPNNKPSQFSHLLMDYKLGKFDSSNGEKKIDFDKKISNQTLGKKPEFIRNLQEPTFYIFK